LEELLEILNVRKRQIEVWRKFNIGKQPRQCCIETRLGERLIHFVKVPVNVLNTKYDVVAVRCGRVFFEKMRLQKIERD
jgi:hypothetical protein